MHYSVNLTGTSLIFIHESVVLTKKHSLNLNQSKSTDYQWNLTDSNS